MEKVEYFKKMMEQYDEQGCRNAKASKNEDLQCYATPIIERSDHPTIAPKGV